MWKEFAGMIYDAMPNNVLQIAIYDPQTERGRLVVIVEDSNISKLVTLSPIVQKIVKKELHIPIIINKFFVETSTDSFPLEFFNMQTSYRNVFVKTDLLKQLEFNKFYIRLEMEREVKRQIILIRPLILQNLEHAKYLQHIIGISTHAMIQVLKGFHFLMNKEVPFSYEDLIETSEKLLNEELHIIKRGLKINEQHLNKEELFEYLNQLINKMMSLMYITEKFPIDDERK